MKKIDKAEYEKRLDRLGEILNGIANHVGQQVLMRCPYKDRFDQCTAQFGCRNKRPPRQSEALPACASDDRLDYRTAWETDPDGSEAMRQTLRRRSKKKQASQSTSMATVSHGGDSRPAESDKTIFDYADELQVRVPTSCGRTGTCHECIVEIRHGREALSERSEAESFLGDEYRLACQAVVERTDSDVEFALLRRSPKILTSFDERLPALDPVVTHRDGTVYYGDEAIDAYRGNLYGLAVDLGTTTIVAELIDLETGRSVYVTSFENPQRFGGSDVMNRISYDSGPFQGELHKAVINTLNTETLEMCAKLGIDRQTIYELVVVGNATMRELFLGRDVQSIGQRPYKSQIELEYREGLRDGTSLCESARKLRLRANKNARVYAAPLIASHVGGDVAAGLLAIDMADKTEVTMFVDCGTNTEVVLGHKGRLLAASCPAGPAFEGGVVQFGMPGCDGAIERIRYVDGRFECETIGDVPPAGICGSGLIDLLAELRRHDLMTPKGVFIDKKTELTIVPEHGITLSRADASHLAQAKAANYCGQAILMRAFGVRPDEINRLYLAGGFANYVDPQSAVDIGFLAPVPPDRIEKAGNAAAQGARQMLLSRRRREQIERLVQTIEHVELETTPDFFEMFVEGCQFKPMEWPD